MIRNIGDLGTVSGVIMSTFLYVDVESKHCDAFYSDKAAMKLLKERNFDLVFSDYLYSAVRYTICDHKLSTSSTIRDHVMYNVQ